MHFENRLEARAILRYLHAEIIHGVLIADAANHAAHEFHIGGQFAVFHICADQIT